MTTKEEKLYTFYKQCQEKNYTDMSDETQALKAKVFAMDLKLRYSDISALYKEAGAVYNAVEERNRIEKEKADALAAKQAVQGKLFLSVTGSGNNSNVTVHRRPDGSVYSVFNNQKIEGIPSFSAERGGVLTYTYHPSKTIFTGASSGGIAMGGFHQTEAYTTESSAQTGKGSVVMQMGDQRITVDLVTIDDEIADKFKRDSRFRTICWNNKITCYDVSSTSMANDLAKMAIQRRHSAGGSYETLMTGLSMAADMRKLPYDKCCTIAEYLGAFVNADYPESDEVLYNRAIEFSEAENSDTLKKAYELFDLISDYKDSKNKGLETKEKYEEVLQREKEQKVIEKERTQKKRNKVLKVAIPLAAVMAAAVFFGKYMHKQTIYNNAVQAEQMQNYEQAKRLYEEIPDFKDARTKADACEVEMQNMQKQAVYDEAVSKMSSGEYDEAIRIFTELGDFGASKEMKKQAENLSSYDTGIKLLKEGKYADAQEVFENLGSFQDAEDKADEAKNLSYDNILNTEAIELMSEERYAEAARILEDLSEQNYKDSKKLYVLCSILAGQAGSIKEDTILQVSDNELLKDDAITSLVNDNEDACSVLLPEKRETWGIIVSSWIAQDDQLIVSEPTLVNSSEKTVLSTIKRYEISKYGDVEELGKTFYTARLVYEKFGAEDAKTPNTFYAFGIDN